tara:strand:- start:8609 stop:8866 length:258 start_codon:yes stop_codon:yes gene_type:complete
MLSDDIWEAREVLMKSYRWYCMDANPTYVGVYGEEIKAMVRQVITDMTRIIARPGMDLPPPAPMPVIEDWDPTKKGQFGYPDPPE